MAWCHKVNDPTAQNTTNAWEVQEIGVAHKAGQNENFTSPNTVVTIDSETETRRSSSF